MNIWKGVYSHFDDVPVVGLGFGSQRWIEQSRLKAERLLEESRADRGTLGWPAFRESLLPAVAALICGELGGVSILDFGGGLGFTFFPVAAGLADGNRLNYHIVEVPPLCELGRGLFHGDPRIHFHEGLSAEIQADIVHIGSALQYVRDWKKILHDLAAFSPRYGVMTDLPAGEIPTFATSQCYYDSRIPYWFFNIHEVIDSMSAVGYRLLFKSAYVATICGVEQDLPQDNLPEHLRVGRSCSLIFGKSAET